MSAAYRQAIAALAAIRGRLGGDLSAEERDAALRELDQVLASLKCRDHNLSTLAMARRVAKLDRDLADRSPRERNSVIRQRLDISRTRLYELRAIAINSPEMSGR